eukprot:UN29723
MPPLIYVESDENSQHTSNSECDIYNVKRNTEGRKKNKEINVIDEDWGQENHKTKVLHDVYNAPETVQNELRDRQSFHNIRPILPPDLQYTEIQRNSFPSMTHPQISINHPPCPYSMDNFFNTLTIHKKRNSVVKIKKTKQIFVQRTSSEKNKLKKTGLKE